MDKIDGWIEVTIVTRYPVNLEHYQVETLEEAVAMDDATYIQGGISEDEILSWGEVVSVEFGAG